MSDAAELWEIRYAESAKNDLKQIVAYIQNELLEPAIAAKLYGDITTAIRSLETMPFRHRLYPEEPWHSKGLRILKVKNHLVFYCPDEDSHMVHIIRILYSGRDIANQLKEIQ